jgi:CMP-N-acetylneuraminate monooxygenase
MQQWLGDLGFTNIRPLRFGEVCEPRRGWRLTIFEPQSYWNDAFCLIDVEGFRLLNLNDGGVNARIAPMVAPVDVVAVQFSGGSSAYPWTWAHVTDEAKIALGERACEGKLKLMGEAAALYQASAVLPFASHFTLWHPSHRDFARMMKRNRVWDAKTTLAGTGIEVIDLLPGDTWDVGKSVIRRATDDKAVYSNERLATYMDSQNARRRLPSTIRPTKRCHAASSSSTWTDSTVSRRLPRAKRLR